VDVSTQSSQLHLPAGIVDYRSSRRTERLNRRLDLDRYQLLTVPATVHTQQQSRNGDQDYDAPPLPVHEQLLGFLNWETRTTRRMGKFSQWTSKKQ
jgi:hypothetical protein